MTKYGDDKAPVKGYGGSFHAFCPDFGQLPFALVAGEVFGGGGPEVCGLNGRSSWVKRNWGGLEKWSIFVNAILKYSLLLQAAQHPLCPKWIQ